MEIIANIIQWVFIIFLGVFLGYLYYNGYFNFEYVKYKKAYDEYHAYILTKKKSYNRYVTDFVNGNQFIPSGDKQPSASELNAKNQSLLSLFELLLEGENLVVKHFQRAKFTYRVEYKNLIDEWNRYEEYNEDNLILDIPILSESIEPIKIEETASLEDITLIADEKEEIESKENISNIPQISNEINTFYNMLTLNSDQKKILIAKIVDYLNTGAKGKSIAFMVLALRELNYLPDSNSYRSIFNAIRISFNAKIGTNRGIYAYIVHDVALQYKVEISRSVNRFKVD